MKFGILLSFMCLCNLLLGAEVPNGNVFYEKALPSEYSAKECHTKKCQFGSASFATMDSINWYTIQIPNYPSTVNLSVNRNHGFVEGDVELTSGGLKILKSGDYSINFAAIMTNPVPSTAPLIPIFLVRNGIFDPNDEGILSGISSVPFETVMQLQGGGILKNVKKGTTLSIVATNGSGTGPSPLTVIAWNVSAFKICCGCSCK